MSDAIGGIAEINAGTDRLSLRIDKTSAVVARAGCYAGLVSSSFEVIGQIHGVETIATGHGIRDLAELQKRFGRGNWRKMKGFATVRLDDGTIVNAEIHWYDAHGIGRRWLKIKRYVD